MTRLTSVMELRELRSMVAADSDNGKPCLVVCAGTACQAGGASDLLRIVKKYIIENDLFDRIAVRVTGCHGFCEMGPFILTEPQKAFYTKVDLDSVPRIIEAVLADEYVEEFLYSDPVSGEVFRSFDDIPFFKYQQRSLLAMNQKIDPIRIYDYMAQGGYEALESVLLNQNTDWVVQEVKKSGLRGRGGAGFLTGVKWEFMAKQNGDRGKFLICNADEGDPGAYMDRSILEGNPHSIIEGMIIGAFGVGATNGIVYVRNEYPLAIKNLTIALRRCHDFGLLGDNILGTDFSFDIQIVKGAGAFVCGEETALIRSIEGYAGEPRQRPPFPVEKGIDGKPTAINNVETWANIPLIFRIGARTFSKSGTVGNSGSKVFSLVGKIKNTGLVEVPMGITIGEIVYDIGGGPSGKQKIKAVQTGGPSGGCIPARMFDLPIDYDSLAKAGSIMGSGGMIVMDENTCMVDVAKYFMNFLKEESCGKCYTCRKGTQRMYEILDGISRGKGTLADLDLLEELAYVVRDTTMCGLGQSAPNPILSTLKYYRDEYEAHVTDGRCAAYVCKELVGAPCAAACPLGTEVWKYVAQIAAGELDDAYQTIRAANPFPSVCARVCSHPCESQCRSGTGDKKPIAIRALKRYVTDHADPSVFTPTPLSDRQGRGDMVAIIGSGPAGLSAAHYLALSGYRPTVYEADDRPGGMLTSGIPAFRLPREVLDKEIEALLDAGVTLRCDTALGRDVTVDSLFEDDYKAVFIATGAHKSRRLGLENEDCKGVYPAMNFLKAYNLHGNEEARGRVAVIGGGNSAIDAARVAVRQSDVETVTILYRRTRDEMPAFEEEIEAALAEGIELQTLVSPAEILSADGSFSGVKVIRNRLGDRGADGRRRPVPIENSETDLPFDTLIVAISELPSVMSVDDDSTTIPEAGSSGSILIDESSLMTSREGVFAGGDVVTGPNTVIDAIAIGKQAAEVIGRWLAGEEPIAPRRSRLPDVYIEPILLDEDDQAEADRPEIPEIPAAEREKDWREVELSLTVAAANREARRCLRCDLEFTQPKEETALVQTTQGEVE